MTEIDCFVRPRVPVCERPEVVAWARELEALFATVELSINRFCQLHAINKGTVSRYLSGNRVPGDRWFLDQLLALRIRAGTPVTDDVRDHLIYLHLQALEVAHPHEYRVLAVKDELETAVTSRRESDRYARSLEEQLNERNRLLVELTTANEKIRTASDNDRATAQAEADRLRQEIVDITAQLHHARQHRDRAEARCQQLEDLIDLLDTGEVSDDRAPTDWNRQAERFGIAVELMETGTPALSLDGVHTLTRIANESGIYRAVVKSLLLEFVRQRALRSSGVRSSLPVLIKDLGPVHAALEALVHYPETFGGLAKADLQHLDLSDTNLARADLRGANLSDAVLRGVNLTGANLAGTSLRSADLNRADLTGADMRDSDLRGVNLTGANVAGADLRGVSLNGTDLRGTNLSDASLILADLRGANLCNAVLRGADLTGAIMGAADLTGAKLREASLRSADLTGSDLRGADLRGAYLSDANLSGANLWGVEGMTEETIRKTGRTDQHTQFGPQPEHDQESDLEEHSQTATGEPQLVADIG